MRNTIYYSILSFFVFCTINAQETNSTLIDYDKTTNWKTNTHSVELNVHFEDLNIFRNFKIDMQLLELAEFAPNTGDVVTILQENIDEYVGHSIFLIQIGDNDKVYETKEKSVSLTKAAWGVNEDESMVTHVDLPLITLNGTDVITIAEGSENLLGKVFRFEGDEKFIPHEPGLSMFTYPSLDGMSYFSVVKPSENSIWTPSDEQLGRILTVTFIGHVVTGMSHHHYGIVLHNPSINTARTINTGQFFDTEPVKWTKVGNRFIEISQGHYVDLDTRLFVNGAVIRSF